ncbi:putative leucine-rich repeat domain superfamily [Helianthus annuus]|nr:putative leucine-rich repeat domain superfamily [Helianthus annuus]
MDASFPNGVWPPNLHSLTIGKLKKPISQWGTQNLPNSVVELYLHGDDGVVSSSQFANSFPSSITHLEIIAFENLESFSMGLQRLNSLQHLTCLECPNLMDLPKALLHSLLSLKVLDCPKLEERCSKRGSYWPHISRIPYIRTQHAWNHEVDMKWRN